MAKNGRNPNGTFRKGSKDAGRKKGSVNKFTSLKDSFLDAFEAIDGTQGLIDWINENKRNRALFYGWITKMLPTNVDLGGNANILFRVIYDPEAKDK